MSPAPLNPAAARNAAMPLPMMRKLLAILLSYHSPSMSPPAPPPSERLTVQARSAAYPVVIEPGLTSRLPATLDAILGARRRFVAASTAIVGAFAAGLILEKAHYRELGQRENRGLEDAMQPLVALLVPIFFVQMGIQVEIREGMLIAAVRVASAAPPPRERLARPGDSVIFVQR